MRASQRTPRILQDAVRLRPAQNWTTNHTSIAKKKIVQMPSPRLWRALRRISSVSSNEEYNYREKSLRDQRITLREKAPSPFILCNTIGLLW